MTMETATFKPETFGDYAGRTRRKQQPIDIDDRESRSSSVYELKATLTYVVPSESEYRPKPWCPKLLRFPPRLQSLRAPRFLLFPEMDERLDVPEITEACWESRGTAGDRRHDRWSRRGRIAKRWR